MGIMAVANKSMLARLAFENDLSRWKLSSSVDQTISFRVACVLLVRACSVIISVIFLFLFTYVFCPSVSIPVHLPCILCPYNCTALSLVVYSSFGYFLYWKSPLICYKLLIILGDSLSIKCQSTRWPVKAYMCTSGSTITFVFAYTSRYSHSASMVSLIQNNGESRFCPCSHWLGGGIPAFITAWKQGTLSNLACLFSRRNHSEWLLPSQYTKKNILDSPNKCCWSPGLPRLVLTDDPAGNRPVMSLTCVLSVDCQDCKLRKRIHFNHFLT